MSRLRFRCIPGGEISRVHLRISCARTIERFNGTRLDDALARYDKAKCNEFVEGDGPEEADRCFRCVVKDAC